jgi:hypothetical protein
MNFIIKTVPATIVLLGMLLALPGCENASSHQGVMDIIKNANTPLERSEASSSIPPQPLVLAQSSYQGGAFYTQTRKDKMERFQCSSCHIGEGMPVNEAKEAAHGDIILQHGTVKDTDACDTCHHLTDRDYLLTQNAMKVDFNHSYQLCGNCHFRQKKDWIGGAHGKRVQNWAGKRVVQNCTSCHNPHSPLFAKRWPATFSLPDTTLPDEENQE